MKTYFSRSLKTVLAVRFILAATLPLLVFGWFGYNYLLVQKSAEITLDLQGHGLNIRNEIEAFVEELQFEMRIAHDTVLLLASGRPGDVDKFLQTLTDSADYFEAVYLLDEKGQVVSLGLASKLGIDRQDYSGVDFSQLELLKIQHHAVRAQDHAFRWSDIFVSPFTGKPAIMLATETPSGTLLATIPLDRLNLMLKSRLRQVEAMEFAVVDHHGTLIAHTNERLAQERTNILVTHPEILGALATGVDVLPKMHEDQSLLENVHVVQETGWIIHSSITQSYIKAQGKALRATLLSALLGAVLLGGALAFWMARRLSIPLRELRDSAQLLAKGGIADFRPAKLGYSEISALSGHLHDMAVAVQEREGALRAGEERYRSVVANLGEGLMIIDLDGVVTECNASAQRILARSQQDLVNRPITGDFGKVYREDGSLMTPGDYPVMASLLQGEVIENQLVGLTRWDGLELWLQINSRPQWTAHGEINSAVVTFTDVTALKLVEESLRKGKQLFEELYQQFQTLLEGISDRITLLTPQMHALWTNQEAGSSCIASTSITNGNCCYEQFFARAEPCDGCPVPACFAAGEAVSSEKSDLDGRIWKLRAFPVKSEEASEVRQVVLMAEDITERRAAEQRQRRSNQLASLGELAAGVAHEINNPISGVINYAQLIVNRSDAQSREHDLARRIIKEGDRIASIVRELLVFSRNESEEVQLVSARVALSEALTLCESHLRKEQVELRIDLPDHLPLIESRSHQIQQLLLNLLTNARHALTEKYPRGDADKRLEVSGEEISVDGRPFVRVKVRDHGCGIPPVLLDKVMNPFFTTKPAGVGTGLGLSISYEIAKRHGGSLQLFSEPGQWTEAVVELPAAPL